MERRNFPNFIDYAKSTFETFDQLSFNEVDSLILSWLVYLHFKKNHMITTSFHGQNIRHVFCAEDFPSMLEHVWTKDETLELLAAVVASPRFRNMQLMFFRDELEPDRGKQFAAVTFRLTDDLYYIAFRGTDWSLAGWEEDFKLCLKEAIPSQTKASQYVDEIAAKCKGRLIIGGHSKGGNLAVYGASHCNKEAQERVMAVYTHDGPGFLRKELEEEGYLAIRNRIHKTVPEFSIFGMMLEQETGSKVVDSHETGLMQHNPMSWEVNNNQLVTSKSMSRAAKRIQNRLNRWVEGLDYDTRATFIDTIFGIIETTGVENFPEIGNDWKRYLPIILQSIKDLDPEMQKFLIRVIHLLVKGHSLSEKDVSLRKLIDLDDEVFL